jgi:hypothetical protein
MDVSMGNMIAGAGLVLQTVVVIGAIWRGNTEIRTRLQVLEKVDEFLRGQIDDLEEQMKDHRGRDHEDLVTKPVCQALHTSHEALMEQFKGEVFKRLDRMETMIRNGQG